MNTKNTVQTACEPRTAPWLIEKLEYQFRVESTAAPAVALHNILDLIQHAGLQADISTTAKAYYYCVELCSRIGDLKSMHTHFHTAEKYARLLHDPRQRGHCLLQSGYFHFYAFNFTAAIEVTERALRLIGRKQCPPRLRTAALYNLGNAYFRNGNWLKAVQHFRQALQWSMQTGNFQYIQRTQWALGELYVKLQDYGRARPILHNSLELARALRAPYRIAAIHNTFGKLYSDLDNYKEALEHFEQAYQLFNSIGNLRSAATAMMNTGMCNLGLGNFEAARLAIDYAAQLCASHGDNKMMRHFHLAIGQHYCRTGKFREALKHLHKANALFTQNNDVAQLCNTHYFLHECYSALHNPGQALHHHKLYIQLQRETLTPKQHRAIIADETAARIASLRQENDRLHDTIRHNRHEFKRGAILIRKLTKILQTQDNIIDRLHAALKSQLLELHGGPQREARQLYDTLQVLAGTDDHYRISDLKKLIHADFINRITAAAPDLTSMELYICLLIRLEYTIPKLAEVLCVTQETVRSHRKKIRKKLWLQPGADLKVLMQTF